MSERKQLDNMLVRILIPGVPWWVAVPCCAIAMTAFGLLLHDPDGNLSLAIALLSLGGSFIYGTVFVRKR